MTPGPTSSSAFSNTASMLVQVSHRLHASFHLNVIHWMSVLAAHDISLTAHSDSCITPKQYFDLVCVLMCARLRLHEAR